VGGRAAGFGLLVGLGRVLVGGDGVLERGEGDAGVGDEFVTELAGDGLVAPCVEFVPGVEGALDLGALDPLGVLKGVDPGGGIGEGGHDLPVAVRDGWGWAHA
jgi:hypothetical protein